MEKIIIENKCYCCEYLPICQGDHCSLEELDLNKEECGLEIYD